MSRSKPLPDQLSRRTRMIQALDPATFLIDERKIETLIDFAIQLAPAITFFDLDNQPVHDSEQPPWARFFKSDVSFLLAHICAQNTQAAFLSARYADADGLLAELGRQNDELAEWYRWAQSLGGVDEPGSIEAAILATIASAYSSELGEDAMLEALDLTTGKNLDDKWFSAGAPTGPDALAHYRSRLSAVSRVRSQIAPAARRLLSRSLEQRADHPAQTGLYLGFIHLLQKSQVQLNTFTERHLDYYFQTVLRLKPASAKPDQTFLNLSLAPNLALFTLPRGTRFQTKPLADGTRAIFATDTDVTLSHARLQTVLARHIRRNSLRNVTAIQQLQSTDFLPRAPGSAPSALDSSDVEDGSATSLITHLKAQKVISGAPGIEIRSRCLEMTAGDRQIIVTLRLSRQHGSTLDHAMRKYARACDLKLEAETDFSHLEPALKDALILSLSTRSGPWQLPDFDLDLTGVAQDELRFVLSLPPGKAPAIQADPNGPDDPYLTVSLNPHAQVYAYSAFENLKVRHVSIDTRVRDLPAAQLGLSKPVKLSEKPVSPFGPAPVPGSSIFVSHPDLAGKQLESFSFAANWMGLPDARGDLAAYYEAYGLGVQNTDFRGTFATRTDETWKPLWLIGTPRKAQTPSVPLFCDPGGSVSSDQNWNFEIKEGLVLPAEAPGIQLTFVAPSYGFGLEEYPKAVARVALENTAKTAKWFRKRIKKLAPVAPPNAPIAPRLSKMRFDYSATASTSAGSVSLARLQPMQPARPVSQPDIFGMDLPGQDVLYLGIERARPLEELTILINHVEDQSARNMPSYENAFAPPRWHYLTRAGWRLMPVANVLGDGPEGFLRAGVIRLSLPGDIALHQDRMPQGKLWLAVASHNALDLLGRLASIDLQAVAVTRVLPDGEAVANLAPVPQGAISASIEPIPEVAKIKQPFAATGGQAAENQQQFRTRVSERLRTKDRAITRHDLETLTLQRFEDIRDAKCILHGLDRLTLVVTPTAGGWSVDHLPYVSLARRREIAAWLSDRLAGWKTEINVINPVFEPVQLRVWVTPTLPVQQGLLHDLNTRFCDLVSPWMTNTQHPINIGTTRVNTADAARAFEGSPGIVFFSGLSLVQYIDLRPATDRTSYHMFKDTAACQDGAGQLRASSPVSVLAPAPDQQILLQTEERGVGNLEVRRDLHAADPRLKTMWETDKRLVPSRPVPMGIGNLKIGQNFIITDPRDVIAPRARINPGHNPVQSVTEALCLRPGS